MICSFLFLSFFSLPRPSTLFTSTFLPFHLFSLFFPFFFFFSFPFLSLSLLLIVHVRPSKVIGGELQDRLIPVPYSKSATDQAIRVVNAFRSGVDSRNPPPQSLLRRAAAMKSASLDTGSMMSPTSKCTPLAGDPSGSASVVHSFSFDEDKDKLEANKRKTNRSIDSENSQSIETAV